MVPMMALKTWWGSCQPSGVFMSTHLYTNLNWCPREVVGGNREGGRNEWCFWMILKKTGHLQFTTSLKDVMSWTQSDAICIVLFLLLHLVLFESRRNGFDPGFHEFRSSKKNSLKTRRWWSHHVGGIWKIGFFAQAEVPKNHKSWRETPTQQEGNFEVGVLIHIFLQSWVLLSYRLILFGWQSKLFFSLNYDYGEEGYGIDMFQIAQVQCLPWQSFKGSERIRLFKSWLRSHPHTHTHKKKVFVFVIYVGFGVFSQWIFVRRFVDFFSESERVFQSHGDDIGISFSPMEIWPCKFHVCVTCATPSRVITMSGRRARHIINPIHRKEHTMWKYLLH